MSHPPKDDKLPPAAAVDQHGCLSTDPFQSKGNQEIVDLVDRLLECGINNTVGVPQIVIVGDQSSGKSSLLHSLTDIPFPVGDGLCTRFPTQIVSRRARSGQDTIRVSIHEDPFSKSKIANVGAFTRMLPSLTSSEFDKLIKEASTLLGLAQPDQHGLSKSSKNFSTNTLKIEVTGPNRTPFTITDLPGLFHASTAEQNKHDMADIRAMVANYIKASSTIIVGVTNGLVNVATQEIFQIARESDTEGLRTVGVITKCDMIGDTTEVIKLAQNRTLPLKEHGWFVVRNRSSRELGITNEERRLRETKLFSSYPWSQLYGSHRGVHALRDYLSTLLLQHSRLQLPEIARETQSHISKAERDIQELGQSRDSSSKQRQFLQGVVAKFQTAAESALNGHYSSSALLGKDMMKLRKRIVEANAEFADGMLQSGHETKFKEVEELPLRPNRYSTPTAPSVNPQPTGLFGSGSGAPVVPATQSTNPRPTGKSGGGFGTGFGGFPAPSTPQFGHSTSATQSVLLGSGTAGSGTPATSGGLFNNLHLSNVFTSPSNGNGGGASVTPRQSYEEVGYGELHPEPPKISFEEAKLVNYRHQSKTKKRPTKSASPPSIPIGEWIKEEIAKNRGTELPGSLNPEVVPALFRRQTAEWGNLAQQHLERIQSIVEDFTKSLLRATCNDGAVIRKLETVLAEFDKAAYNQSKAQLDELIRDQREKPLQTNNPLYIKNVKSARRLRFNNALSRYLQREGQLDNEEGDIRLRDPSSLFDVLHISNPENLADEIHDTLKAYYDLQVVDFFEFVNKHIVERYVGATDGPVRSFSPLWVAGLQDAELAELASESQETLAKRKEKEGVLRRFRRAENLLKNHSPDV
ncbi:MAG: hypothetical protein M1840_002175 [Geoglossum simile]|nr:MAG: hypothetical protein M1840_002175 [Geoglossum simile]